MITRFATLFGRMSALLAITALVTACGGGGGGGGGGFIDGGGGGGDVEDAYFLALTLEDGDGNPTTTVSTSRPVTLKVKVTRRGANGAAIDGALVSAEADLGTLTPATALSNADGIAQFTLEGGTDRGAGAITATVANEDGVETTQSLNYQVGTSGLRLGHFEDGMFIENEIGVKPNSDIVYRGSAELFVDIVDEQGERVSSTETVTLRSNCLATGKATLDPASPVETSTGNVTTTFTAIDCSGADEITATIPGGGSAFATLTIGSPRANSLTFISAEPDLIVLKGTGGGSSRQESSIVTFQVIDSSNNPLPDVDVNFSLTTSVGGLALTPSSATSNDDGTVQVTLFSGDVSTVVRVIASVLAGDGSGQTLSTVSDILTVSTGLPDQNSISLSVEGNFVIENGFTMDGVQRCITVRMADKYNNPVPNGTSAIFTTEYGTIDPSCVTGERNGERAESTSSCTAPPEGQCSVLWTSGEPRGPTLSGAQNETRTIFNTGCNSLGGENGPCPDDLGPVRAGRSTVLVTAIGEESFVDRNGNGVMDEAEQDLFANLPEAFIDHNEDNQFNPALPGCANSTSATCLSGAEETFVDFNSDNVYNKNNSPALYNGLLCPPEGDDVWCSRTLLNVFDDLVLVLTRGDVEGWFIQLASGSTVQPSTSEGQNYDAYISDIFNNKPPGGSTISIEATDGKCQVSKDSFTVPNTSLTGAYRASFSILPASGDNSSSQPVQGCPRESGTDTLRITLTPSDNSPTESVLYSCTWDNDAPQGASDPNEPLSC